MTGQKSLQFIEHLRQARHLTSAETGQVEDPRPADQPQGDAQRNLQSASQIKIWEATDLSASEFADEAARFYNYERATLEDMLSATPLVASFSQRFLRETLVFPYQTSDHDVVLAIADPTDLAARRAALEDPAVTGDPSRLKVACVEMDEAQNSLDRLYERWAELERKKGSA